MKKSTYKTLYLGLDVSKRKIQIYARSSEEEKGVSLTIENSKESIKEFFLQLPDLKNTVVAMETGFDSPWMSDYIAEFGCEVIVAHARDIRLIWGSTAKCDRRDAEMLARLACVDKKLLHPIKHGESIHRDDLCVIKARDTLVRFKVHLINMIRSLLRSHGEDIDGLTPENLLEQAPKVIPESMRPALNGLLIQLASIRAEIKKYDRIVLQLCKKYPETERIRQIRGIGPITALTFVLIIGDPMRFGSGERLAAYLGLVPRRDQSGETDKQLGITKQGNSLIRRYLMQGAQYIMGHFGNDCDLKNFGDRIAARGGKIARKKATVALARKLCCLMYVLWKTNAVYDPKYKSNKNKRPEVLPA